MANGKIRVGTSGWRHRHWRGHYYPEELAVDEWLGRYAAEFSCVEITETFHELPGTAEISRWCQQTEADFRFALVCPREVTHEKRLKNCGEPLTTFLLRLERFGERLGPVLFRLPARWHCNIRRLSDFLARLPDGRDYAFEFPDRSWHTGAVRGLLSGYGAAFCLVDGAAGSDTLDAGAGVAYIRLPGPRADGVTGYHVPALRTWAGRSLGWQRKGQDVYLFLGNDGRAYAVKNARTLQNRTGERSTPPRSAIP